MNNPPFSNWVKDKEHQEKLEGLVSEFLREVQSYVSPKGIVNVLRREKTDIDGYAPPDPILKSEFLVVGVVTIGERADKTPMKDKLLDSLVTDALENVVLIKAQRKIIEFIKGEAEKSDLKTMRVIPPGSGRTEWGIENQESIFKNLEPEKIGVKLTPGYSIKPKKSLSFIMGLGHDIEQASDLFSCDGCKRLNCAYRT